MMYNWSLWASCPHVRLVLSVPHTSFENSLSRASRDLMPVDKRRHLSWRTCRNQDSSGKPQLGKSPWLYVAASVVFCLHSLSLRQLLHLVQFLSGCLKELAVFELWSQVHGTFQSTCSLPVCSTEVYDGDFKHPSFYELVLHGVNYGE